MENKSGPLPSPWLPAPSTTFVQTDASTFKELVQRLTGPHEDLSAHISPPSPKPTGIRKPTFKLHERRQSTRLKLTITKPNSSVIPLTGLSLSSPSGLISPSLSGSLVSPLADFSGLRVSNQESSKESNLGLDEEAEEKAIRERRFYLHPSPRASSPRNAEPELLTLFPLTSPSLKPVGP